MRCVLCGAEVEDEICDEYIDELNGQNFDYCRTCRDFLKVRSKKDGDERKRIKKVEVRTSNYYLPGFELSEDKTHYVKKK